MRRFDCSRGDIVIYPSRIKLVGVLLLCALFCLMSAWLFDRWWSAGRPIEPIPIVALLGFLMGVASGIYAFFRLVVRRPAVVLSTEGLYDNASGVAAGFVPWESIDAMLLYRQQNQTFLGAVPRDVPAFLAAQNRLKRAILRGSLRLGAPPIAIPQSALPMPARELAQQIASRYPVRVLLD